jgi:molecular chaperone GrpE
MPETEHPDTPDAAAAGAAAAEAGGGDPVAELRQALEKSEATAAENWNRYLRAVAELDNVRKRAARDVEAARRSGVEKLAGELLGIVDSLEMGLETAGSATAESLLAGKQATLRLLRAAFEKFGIELVDPVGHPFDPQLHEAMSMQPSTTATPGSAGGSRRATAWRLVLRPARDRLRAGGAGSPCRAGQARPT